MTTTTHHDSFSLLFGTAAQSKRCPFKLSRVYELQIDKQVNGQTWSVCLIKGWKLFWRSIIIFVFFNCKKLINDSWCLEYQRFFVEMQVSDAPSGTIRTHCLSIMHCELIRKVDLVGIRVYNYLVSFITSETLRRNKR